MAAQPSSPNAPARPRRLLLALAAAAALAAVVVVALALLGGGDKGITLAEAAANMEGESMRARFDMDATERGGSYSFAGEGTFSADSTAGTMKGTMTGVGEEPVVATLRMKDADLWMAADQFAGLLPKGKRWMHMSDPSLAGQTLTPSEFVGFLRGADDVENLGEESVAGTRATHYRGSVDVEDLAEETGGQLGERVRRALGGSDVRMPIDVWVTPDGLPKVMRFRVAAGGETVRMEIEVLEYGVPVDVKPPPARTVVEESELGW